MNLLMIKKLFNDKKATFILMEMFETKYLKRQFYHTRADKKAMAIHYRRIR